MTRILVVDDEPDIRRLVSFSLKRGGFEVLEASDGMTACEIASAEKPDLILMDVMMPLMNGFDACRKLKANEATADIPILMLSAKSQSYEQEEGLQAGAEGYVTKPFTPGELVEQVNSHLAGKG